MGLAPKNSNDASKASKCNACPALGLNDLVLTQTEETTYMQKQIANGTKCL